MNLLSAISDYSTNALCSASGEVYCTVGRDSAQTFPISHIQVALSSDIAALGHFVQHYMKFSPMTFSSCPTSGQLSASCEVYGEQ